MVTVVESIPINGARRRKNTSRQLTTGRPPFKYPTNASPTSDGIGRHRESIDPIALASHHDLAGPPIQILQPQPGNFS